MDKENLNKLTFNATNSALENAFYYISNNDIKYDDQAFCQKNHSRDFKIKESNISVYFKDLEHNLIRKIEKANVVVGCVAWLTNENIIDALSSKSGVSIIVQKEKFLNYCEFDFNDRLRSKYSKLKTFNINYIDAPKAAFLSSGLIYTDKRFTGLEPVRCVGTVSNEVKNKNIPRMHNKFVVFCSEKISMIDESFDERNIQFTKISSLEPYAVWTGSYNFTKNANNSLENAIYIEDNNIAEAFFNEWGQIATLSELLDWQSMGTNPEAIFD